MPHTIIPHLLQSIFNRDFSETAKETFADAFFARPLTLADLQKVHGAVASSEIAIAGKAIPSAIRIPGSKHDAPFCILAQLHGNEPAGLSGILLAMALSRAGLLQNDVIGIIGNPLASFQYFNAWEKAPGARQETRDCYRCGLSDDGTLLPDMNRIPVDFMDQLSTTHHIKRAQELFAVGKYISGILDIHSARGNMVCITDHKRDADLKHSPIRNILTDLAEAISAHASSAVTVQTFKTILSPLPNIISQTGIEAGRHEDPDAPQVAASFTLSLLHTLGLTEVAPLYKNENGVFTRYSVQPRITYADLVQEGALSPGDKVYMAKQNNAGHIVHHQYEEMEAIKKGQVVAVAEPSGTIFKAPTDFSTLFISKSAELYDKDPAVGPWPVAADKLANVKFSYPCIVSPMKLSF